MDALARESKFSGRRQKITGGEVVVTGAVTEFGRRNVGNKSLGGLIHKSKSQMAYGKVQLSVVDVNTSEVLASYQGAGEYQLTSKEVLGFGSKAGYDSTLADKVLNLAMMEAVDNLVSGLERSEWSPN
jgi:curli biogenesis system outer membrane secretion channel CsgG